MSTVEPIRVALLGAGERGRSVIRHWATVAECKIVAILDPSPAAHERCREALGDLVRDAELVTDIRGWLAHGQADVVTINSWDAHHAQNATDCFEAGFNVHVAKPMTQTLAEADRVYAAWLRSGCIGVVDMQLRTSPLIREAMEIVRSGVLGRIRLIDVFDMVGMGGAFQRSTRTRQTAIAHSTTLQKGVHFLDLCNCIMQDDPVRVFATGGRDFFGGNYPPDLHCEDCTEAADCLYEGRKMHIGGIPFPRTNSLCVYASDIDIVDNLAATIEYRGGGRISYAECHGTPEYETRYDVIGTRGSLLIRYGMDERNYLELRRLHRPGLVERIPIFSKGAHGGGDEAIVRIMAEALRQARNAASDRPALPPELPDIRAGRQAVALCNAVDESIATQQVVTIKPVPEVAGAVR